MNRFRNLFIYIFSFLLLISCIGLVDAEPDLIIKDNLNVNIDVNYVCDSSQANMLVFVAYSSLTFSQDSFPSLSVWVDNRIAPSEYERDGYTIVAFEGIQINKLDNTDDIVLYFEDQNISEKYAYSITLNRKDMKFSPVVTRQVKTSVSSFNCDIDFEYLTEFGIFPDDMNKFGNTYTSATRLYALESYDLDDNGIKEDIYIYRDVYSDFVTGNGYIVAAAFENGILKYRNTFRNCCDFERLYINDNDLYIEFINADRKTLDFPVSVVDGIFCIRNLNKISNRFLIGGTEGNLRLPSDIFNCLPEKSEEILLVTEPDTKEINFIGVNFISEPDRLNYAIELYESEPMGNLYIVFPEELKGKEIFIKLVLDDYRNSRIVNDIVRLIPMESGYKAYRVHSDCIDISRVMKMDYSYISKFRSFGPSQSLYWDIYDKDSDIGTYTMKMLSTDIDHNGIADETVVFWGKFDNKYLYHIGVFENGSLKYMNAFESREWINNLYENKQGIVVAEHELPCDVFTYYIKVNRKVIEITQDGGLQSDIFITVENPEYNLYSNN